MQFNSNTDSPWTAALQQTKGYKWQFSALDASLSFDCQDQSDFDAAKTYITMQSGTLIRILHMHIVH